MSQVLWCDFGDHAFSTKEKGWRNITLSGQNSFNETVSDSWTACVKHVPGTPKALEMSIPSDDE